MILFLNAVVSAGAAVAAIMELLRPGFLLGETPLPASGHFYGRLYAVRALPFAVVAGCLPFLFVGAATAAVLFASAVSQAADALLGMSQRKWPMFIGPSLAAIVHVLCAYTLLRV